MRVMQQVPFNIADCDVLDADYGDASVSQAQMLSIEVLRLAGQRIRTLSQCWLRRAFPVVVHPLRAVLRGATCHQLRCWQLLHDVPYWPRATSVRSRMWGHSQPAVLLGCFMSKARSGGGSQTIPLRRRTSVLRHGHDTGHT